MLRRSWIVLPIALLATVIGACTDDARPAPTGTSPPASAPGADEPPTIAKVVAFANLSEEDAAPVVYPAFQAAGLAIDAASERRDLPVELEVEVLDTEGDPEVTRRLIDEASQDPEVIGAIMSPFVPQPEALVKGLLSAGIGTVSLSTLGSGPRSSGPVAWRRMVAPQSLQARALVRSAREAPRARSGVCLVGQRGPATAALFGSMVRLLGGDVVMRAEITEDPAEAATSVAGRIAREGCAIAVWSGFADGAAALRVALSDSAGTRVRFLVSDGAKAQEYLDLAGALAEGSRASCACIDLSTSTDLADQRFINRFQFDIGATPGAYAVEGWDAGSLIATLVTGGATTRASLAEALSQVRSLPGLAEEYRFGEGGDLVPASQRVRISRAEGSRWIPAGSIGG